MGPLLELRMYDASIVTVITPAAHTRLASLAALKTELGIAAGDTSQDAVLTGYLDTASSSIHAYCGRDFGQKTLLETFRWAYQRNVGSSRPVDAIQLRQTPIMTIDSITADSVTLDPTADFEFDPYSGEVFHLCNDCRMPWWAAKLQVQYTGGYALPEDAIPNLPATISRAAVLTAAAIQRGVGRDTAVRSEMVEGVGSTSYFDTPADTEGLPPAAAALLAGYRIIAVH